MRSDLLLGFGIMAFASVALPAMAQEPHPAPTLPAIAVAVDGLQGDVPAARIDRDGFGRTYCYGAQLGAGALDPDLAVEAWLASYSEAIGVAREDLELVTSNFLSDGRSTVFAYRTWSGEVPIEGGSVRILVRPTDGDGRNHVVYAAAHTALVPDIGYPVVQVAAAAALATARGALPAPELAWSEPALVIEPSATRRAPSRLVWHVGAHRGDAVSLESWTVVIDPVDGTVLATRDELLEVDVEGEVRGWVTPANEPDSATNPPAEIPLVGARVRVVGGSTAFSESDGSFTIPHGGTGPVTVETSLLGEWASVFDVAGPGEIVSAGVTPPGPVTLTFDAAFDPLIQAQINGFHFATMTHNFIRERTTGIPSLDVSIPVNVNILDTCNAYYDPGAETINFFLAGGGCVNTSFSSVVAHEYGHFIVDMLGVPQGAFGEGFGDVVSMLMFDDPIIGSGFAGPGTVVRDPVAANVQYPCSGSVHFCGQLVGGVWWNIRAEFGALSGSAPGLADSQLLFTDWAQITIGGQGSSSAHPQTAIEVLTVDDHDGFLDNGTPHYPEICAAFAGHSIACPPLPPVLILFPAGLPTSLAPQTPTDLEIEITAGSASPVSSSATLLVRGAGQPGFISVPLTSLGGDDYIVTIPPQECGGTTEFYVEVDDDAGSTTTAPGNGAAGPFTVDVYDVIESWFSDDLETDLGWVVGAPTDTATTGIWTRVAPIGTAAAPGSDHSDPGSQCFVTGQGLPGGGAGANDVDGGFTTLMTPSLDLSDPGDYRISYWRWFSNDTSAQPNTEVLTIEISDDDGQSWTEVEVVGPAGPGTSGGWILHEFDVAAIIAPSATMRLRFIAGDPDPGSLVEAGIDDFEVVRRLCDPEPQFRRGDVNGDQTINITDPIVLLDGLFAGMPLNCLDAADVTDDGTLNIADPVVLLDHLFVSGNPLAEPFLACGPDPTPEALDCAVEPPCP